MVNPFRRLPHQRGGAYNPASGFVEIFPRDPRCRQWQRFFLTTRVPEVHGENRTRKATHEVALPIGTAFHERTFALCQSLNYREWSGYYTVSVYEVHHEHEYNAIRNACALIDISPLYKYLITGKDATKLVNRVITRDVNKVAVGQVIYACWCDEDGKVIDDGTITRLEESKYRWTAADPSLRWFRQNGLNMDVQIEDISEQTAALALQGPTSAKLLKTVADADISNLKYFRKTSGKIAGVPVDISRTGYTGDLGYEIWIPWNAAVKVWDSLRRRQARHRGLPSPSTTATSTWARLRPLPFLRC